MWISIEGVGVKCLTWVSIFDVGVSVGYVSRYCLLVLVSDVDVDILCWCYCRIWISIFDVC